MAAGLPPQLAAHIQPGNPVQQLLLQRLHTLTPQDGQTLATGVSPAAFAVLKKFLPEIGFIFDLMSKGAQGGGPPGPGAPGPQPGAPGAGPMPPPGAPPAGPPQMPVQRPATTLGSM